MSTKNICIALFIYLSHHKNITKVMEQHKSSGKTCLKTRKHSVVGMCRTW